MALVATLPIVLYQLMKDEAQITEETELPSCRYLFR